MERPDENITIITPRSAATQPPSFPLSKIGQAVCDPPSINGAIQ